MDLVIDRTIWLRGEGAKASRLLRNDGKMCCVGIYLEACGVPRGELLDRSTFYILPSAEKPDQASWLDEPAFSLAPSHATQLYAANDAEMCSDREQTIAAIFAKHDVTVTFVGPEVQP